MQEEIKWDFKNLNKTYRLVDPDGNQYNSASKLFDKYNDAQPYYNDKHGDDAHAYHARVYHLAVLSMLNPEKANTLLNKDSKFKIPSQNYLDGKEAVQEREKDRYEHVGPEINKWINYLNSIGEGEEANKKKGEILTLFAKYPGMLDKIPVLKGPNNKLLKIDKGYNEIKVRNQEDIISAKKELDILYAIDNDVNMLYMIFNAHALYDQKNKRFLVDLYTKFTTEDIPQSYEGEGLLAKDMYDVPTIVDVHSCNGGGLFKYDTKKQAPLEDNAIIMTHASKKYFLYNRFVAEKIAKLDRTGERPTNKSAYYNIMTQLSYGIPFTLTINKEKLQGAIQEMELDNNSNQSFISENNGYSTKLLNGIRIYNDETLEKNLVGKIKCDLKLRDIATFDNDSFQWKYENSQNLGKFLLHKAETLRRILHHCEFELKGLDNQINVTKESYLDNEDVDSIKENTIALELIKYFNLQDNAVTQRNEKRNSINNTTIAPVLKEYCKLAGQEYDKVLDNITTLQSNSQKLPYMEHMFYQGCALSVSNEPNINKIIFSRAFAELASNHIRNTRKALEDEDGKLKNKYEIIEVFSSENAINFANKSIMTYDTILASVLKNMTIDRAKSLLSKNSLSAAVEFPEEHRITLYLAQTNKITAQNIEMLLKPSNLQGYKQYYHQILSLGIEKDNDMINALLCTDEFNPTTVSEEEYREVYEEILEAAENNKLNAAQINALLNSEDAYSFIAADQEKYQEVYHKILDAAKNEGLDAELINALLSDNAYNLVGANKEKYEEILEAAKNEELNGNDIYDKLDASLEQSNSEQSEIEQENEIEQDEIEPGPRKKVKINNDTVENEENQSKQDQSSQIEDEEENQSQESSYQSNASSNNSLENEHKKRNEKATMQGEKNFMKAVKEANKGDAINSAKIQEISDSVDKEYENNKQMIQTQDNKHIPKGSVILLPEKDHQKDHGEYLKLLIDASTAYHKNTIAFIELKEDGENRGMKDITKLARMIEDNANNKDHKQIIILESPESNLYKEAEYMNNGKIPLKGMEGKDIAVDINHSQYEEIKARNDDIKQKAIAHGMSQAEADEKFNLDENGKVPVHMDHTDKRNNRLYHQIRDEYMTKNIMLGVNAGMNAIVLVGAAHIENLEAKLEEHGVEVKVGEEHVKRSWVAKTKSKREQQSEEQIQKEDVQGRIQR